MTTTAPTATSPVSVPVTTTTTGTASSSNSAMQQLSGNFDTFLQLLTTQLKNQDPTSPMDTNDFTQQLVEYSQVEQQIDTNTNLQTLIGQANSQSAAYATTYLGKTVSVTNGNAALTGGQAQWTYNLGTQAAATTLTVTDANGRVVYVGPGATTAGTNSFDWNGQDNNGNQLADGVYTLKATATAANGAPVTTTVASAGTVGEIDMTNGTPQLAVGAMRLGLSDIADVTN